MDFKTKRSIFGWSMYDWANSAFATTVMAGFFPIFFKEFWSVGVDATVSTARLGLANSIAGIFVAFLGPILGAIADRASAKKKFLAFLAYMGVAATSALFMVDKGNWMLAAMLYIFGTIGFSVSIVFSDSLLTNVASEERRDFVSSFGYALGYLGGGILFTLNVLMVLKPDMFGFADKGEAVRFSFLSVGIWWAIFSIPVFLFVKEEKNAKDGSIFIKIKEGVDELISTFREIRRLKNISMFLIALWLYMDGVDTIIRMAVDYGMSIGFDSNDLILALLITQFVGFPATIGFGFLGSKIGAKNGIFIAIGVYILITVWGTFMHSKTEFYALAVAIGLVQGGIQALSRSFYSNIIPPDKTAQYFGFYNMIGKFAVIIGPVLMGGIGLMVRGIGFESETASRASMFSVSILLIAGGVLLFFVDIRKARIEAGLKE